VRHFNKRDKGIEMTDLAFIVYWSFQDGEFTLALDVLFGLQFFSALPLAGLSEFLHRSKRNCTATVVRKRARW
jgi:hypothetical protein